MHNSTKRATVILGVIMIVAIGSSAILPLLGGNIQNPQTNVQPTDVPIPTFPAPITNLQSITFDQTYLHPTGLFTVAQPTGWDQAQPFTSADTARVTLSNFTALSVVEVSVIQPETPVTTPEELDARYTSEYIRQSWSRYQNPRETARRTVDDKLVIDFEMTLQRQTYVARQESWTDGNWIYEVRVVTPENATDTLRYLLDNIIGTFHPNTQLAGSPTDWNAYFDSTNDAFIRYPSTWILEDDAPGRLASITADNDTVLRIEAQPDTTIGDEDAVRDWLEAERGGATVLSIEPITRDESEGFSVAYSFTNIDGEAQSGLVVLLNGPDNALHVANLRFAGADIDLNTDAGQEAFGDLAAVMDTFTLMPSLNIVEATEEAPTP
jgi:hypothetical protein